MYSGFCCCGFVSATVTVAVWTVICCGCWALLTTAVAASVADVSSGSIVLLVRLICGAVSPMLLRCLADRLWLRIVVEVGKVATF